MHHMSANVTKKDHILAKIIMDFRKILEVILEMIIVRILVVIMEVLIIMEDLNLLVEGIFLILFVRYVSFLVMEPIDAKIGSILHLFLRRTLAEEISEDNLVETGLLIILAEGQIFQDLILGMFISQEELLFNPIWLTEILLLFLGTLLIITPLVLMCLLLDTFMESLLLAFLIVPLHISLAMFQMVCPVPLDHHLKQLVLPVLRLLKIPPGILIVEQPTTSQMIYIILLILKCMLVMNNYMLVMEMHCLLIMLDQ